MPKTPCQFNEKLPTKTLFVANLHFFGVFLQNWEIWGVHMASSMKTPWCPFSSSYDFPTSRSRACNGLSCPQSPLCHQNAPLSSAPRIRLAFSKREFIKGKPFTQLLPLFCPLFISPCKYLSCWGLCDTKCVFFTLPSPFRPILSLASFRMLACHTVDQAGLKEHISFPLLEPF